MTDKESAIVEAVAALPPEMQDWALGVLTGAAMAVRRDAHDS